MTKPAMDGLDRHALVLALWLSFGFMALVLFRMGFAHDRWMFVAAGYAMIILAFIAHVLVNVVLHAAFKPKEIVLGLVFYGTGLVVFALATILSPTFRAAQFLPVSLGFITLFAAVVLYMITWLGVRGAFNSFNVIRQFKRAGDVEQA